MITNVLVAHKHGTWFSDGVVTAGLNDPKSLFIVSDSMVGFQQEHQVEFLEHHGFLKKLAYIGIL